MRSQTVVLVEAARQLDIMLSPTDGNPDGIRILCPKDAFPSKLAALRRAVDEWDAAAGQEASVRSPMNEPAVMRMALDAVFRWMRGQGMDVAEPHAAVAAVLRTAAKENATAAGAATALAEKARQADAPRPKPSYAHDAVKKGRKPRPLLNLVPEPGRTVTLQGLRQKNLEAEMTLNSLGAAAPK